MAKRKKIVWRKSLTRRAHPLFIVAVEAGRLKYENIIPKRRDHNLLCWNGLTVDIYFDRQELKCEARALTQEIFRSPRYNQKYLNRTLRICKSAESRAKNLNKKKFKTFTNSQLFEEFDKTYSLFEKTGTTILRPRDHAQGVLENFLKKKIKSDPAKFTEYLNILVSPTKFSLAREEEINFLRLSKDFKEKRLSKAKLDLSLEKHLKNYAWIPTDFGMGKHWTRSDLKKKLNDYLKISLTERIKELKREPQKLIKRKSAIITKLKMSRKSQRLAEICALTGFIRLHRRYVWSQIFYYGEFLLKELQRRLKLKSLDDLLFLTYEEIHSALLQNQPIDKTLLRTRQRTKFVVHIIKDKVNYYSGNEAIRYLNSQTFEKIPAEIKELKGTPAFVGRIKGKVKIVSRLSDMTKVLKGDILVANETTPDLLPAMKRAGAFVTDEGGLGCHAAIIARELKKPCVVGTKIATKVLKDKDLVEVDAEKGIIKKLS